MPNELARDFTGTRPNERWVTDITYVWTEEGWAYSPSSSTYSRAPSSAGRSIPPSRRALPLVALDMAIARRRPAKAFCTTQTEAANTPALSIASSSAHSA